MHTTRCAGLNLAAVVVVALWLGRPVEGRGGQDEMSPALIAELEHGEQVYVARCANCHGIDGDQIPGINLLSGTFRRRYTDRQLVNVIRTGIAGTPMVPTGLPEERAAVVVKYLRWSAGAPVAPAAASATALAGRPASGKTLYEGKGSCVTCHQIQGVGGYLGPDLSNIGAARQPAELERSMTDPDADIRPDSRIARVTDADGTVVVGRLLSDDTHLLQLVTQDGQVHSFARADLRHLEVPTSSGMPTYAGALTSQEIADIVSYLQTLNAPAH